MLCVFCSRVWCSLQQRGVRCLNQRPYTCSEILLLSVRAATASPCACPYFAATVGWNLLYSFWASPCTVRLVCAENRFTCCCNLLGSQKWLVCGDCSFLTHVKVLRQQCRPCSKQAVWWVAYLMLDNLARGKLPIRSHKGGRCEKWKRLMLVGKSCQGASITWQFAMHRLFHLPLLNFLSTLSFSFDIFFANFIHRIFFATWFLNLYRTDTWRIQIHNMPEGLNDGFQQA